MQSFDDRSRSTLSPVSTQEAGQLILSTEPLPQNDSIIPVQTSSDQASIFSSKVPEKFTPPPMSNVTRVLTGMLTGSEEGAVQRPPVIIRGNMKKADSASQMPHPRRRKIITLLGILALFLVVSVSFLTAMPLGHTVDLNINPLSSNSNMGIINNRSSSNTINSVVAQATATAIYTNQQADGYDPYTNGNMTVASNNSSLLWPYGQCTYWANYEYHALTGWYVAWGGNANQWVAGANAAGWNVSTTPHVPSIIVLMPGVQGASYMYGHVAVVTSIIDSTTVMTSNMNWYANRGGLGIVSNVEFNYGPGYGVYFAWHS